MANDPRATKLHVDRDGVRFHQNPGVRKPVWLLVLAIALVGIAVLMVMRPALQRRVRESVARQDATIAGNAAPNAPAARLAAKPLRPAAPPQVEVAPPPPQVEPAHPSAGTAEPPPANDDANAEAPMFGPAVPGEGVALFPPPGTKPIKRGIVVPEDFELPAGYVRHYQTTDDGQRLPAILMFHPDYQPTDEHGAPIALPADRVVPPEMAPPGLPIQVLEAPDNPEPPPEGAENPSAQDSPP